MQTTQFGNFFGLGPTELIIILVILVLLFGSTQLPKLARSFRKSAEELRSGLKDSEDDSSQNKTAKK